MVDQLEIVKHYVKGGMFVIRARVNGVDDMKFILLNISTKDKIEVVIQFGVWRVFVNKACDVGNFSVITSCIDGEDHNLVVSALMKRKFLCVRYKGYMEADVNDDGYSSDPDVDKDPAYVFFH